jgi:hypothetical protein
MVWSLDRINLELLVLHQQEMWAFEKLEQWLYLCLWTFLTTFVFCSSSGGLGVFPVAAF